MTTLLAGVVAIAFVTGLAVGTYRAAAKVRYHRDNWYWIRDENETLKRQNAELRAEVFGHIFRPVRPEEADKVMAEWLSRWDPQYRERTE